MKKRFIIMTLILFISSSIYCQDKDNDGDRIFNNEEQDIFDKYKDQPKYSTYFNPYIADVPSVSITFTGAVNIGVLYKSQGAIKRKIEIKQDEITAAETEDYKKTYNTKSYKNVTQIKVNLSYNIGKGFEGGMEIKNNFTSDHTSGVEIKKTEINKWREEHRKLTSQIEEKSLTFDGDAGYIQAAVKLYNPHILHAVEISNIVFNVYAYDVISGTKDDLPFVDSREVNLKPVLSNSGGNSSGGKSQGNENVISLSPHEVKNRLVEITDINSERIISLLERGKSIIFEIESYDVLVKTPIENRSISFSNISQTLRTECFKLRIINDLEDQTFYIAKKDSNGKFINLKQALSYIYPDENQLSFEKDRFKNIEFEAIKKIEDKVSNLNINVKPENYSSANLNQGYWFKLIKEGSNYKGLLEEELRGPDIEVTLVYLTGKEIQKKEENTISVIGTWEKELVNNSIINTEIRVNRGDIVELTLTPYVKEYSQILTQSTFSGLQLSPNQAKFCNTMPDNSPGASKPLFDYRINSIKEEWKYKVYTTSTIKNTRLFFKFGDKEMLYSLANLRPISQEFNNPNQWIIKFKVPNDLETYINYPIFVQLDESSFASDTFNFIEGLPQEEHTRINQNINNYSICPRTRIRISNFLNENIYRTTTKRPEYKFNISIVAKRTEK